MHGDSAKPVYTKCKKYMQTLSKELTENNEQNNRVYVWFVANEM